MYKTGWDVKINTHRPPPPQSWESQRIRGPVGEWGWNGGVKAGEREEARTGLPQGRGRKRSAFTKIFTKPNFRPSSSLHQHSSEPGPGSSGFPSSPGEAALSGVSGMVGQLLLCSRADKEPHPSEEEDRWAAVSPHHTHLSTSMRPEPGQPIV